jgi:membrane associated rhomboid family serine protease
MDYGTESSDLLQFFMRYQYIVDTFVLGLSYLYHIYREKFTGTYMTVPNPQEPTPRRVHPLERRPTLEEVQPRPRGEQLIFDLKRAAPVVTYTLIAINVLIFVYGMIGQDTEALWIAGANNGGWVFTQGEYYRLFTSMFLHAGLAHILFNMYALYILGAQLEQLYGRWRFLAIYLLGGLTGSVASAALNLTGPRDWGVGASGAVFAVIGATVVYFYRYRESLGQFGKGALRHYAGLVLINVLIGLTIPNIDNTAHMGGLVGGMLLGFLLAPVLITRQTMDYLGNWLRVVRVSPRTDSGVVTAVYSLGLIGVTVIAGALLF